MDSLLLNIKSNWKIIQLEELIKINDPSQDLSRTAVFEREVQAAQHVDWKEIQLKGQLYGSTFTEKLSRSANIQTEKSCEEKKRLQDRSYDRRKRNRYARYGSAASRDDVDRSPMRRTGANKKFACRLENTTIEKSILNTIHPKEL